MKCPLCEKESSKLSFTIDLNDETLYVCKECIKKAEDDIFFDNLDMLHRTHVTTENLSYFNNPFFKFYDMSQKLFFNNVMKCYGIYSKT